jgi:hypothetical protein
MRNKNRGAKWMCEWCDRCSAFTQPQWLLSGHKNERVRPMDPSDCHILVVDDERISQVVVSSLLRKCNYKGKGN